LFCSFLMATKLQLLLTTSFLEDYVRKLTICLGLLAAFLATVGAASASEITITFPGKIGEFMVDSVSFGISGAYSKGGGNTKATNVTIGDITITSPVDKSSSELLLDETDGKSLPTVTIGFFKTSFSTTTPYEEVELKNVLISSFQVLSNGVTQPTEQFTLNFTGSKFQYAGQSGNPLGAFLPLADTVQEGPFRLDLDLGGIPGITLDAQLGDSDIQSAADFGTVPEPASLMLLASGLLAVSLGRKRGN